MKYEKTINALKNNGYQVSYFESHEKAVDYLDDRIKNTTVGFGGSTTLRQIKIYERLIKSNTIYDPDRSTGDDGFYSVAKKSLNTEYYMTSINGLSEDGIIVNLDGTGNRVASSIFGHKKVYFIVGTNKIAKNLEETIWRVRNIAAPKNAKRLNLKTPCALKANKCYNCSSPERICNGLLIQMKKMDGIEMEVVLINEDLGF